MAIDLFGEAAYCVDFGPQPAWWEWSLIEMETLSTSPDLVCHRPWVVVRSDRFNQLVSESSLGSQWTPPVSDSPFNLSLSEGSQIAGAILAVWAM
ncbi:MAG: hypothetical protein V4532_19365, partial [Pseudomonadota bacterium]